MTNETTEQVYIVRDRADCADLNHEQLVEAMLAEAKEDGYTPSEYTELGSPIIYLRGQYQIDVTPHVWQKDLFMMPVTKI